MTAAPIRTRWAAIGAAAAVSVGAGGVGLIHATDPSEATTFVPITPCRLFDTRPGFQVGTRGAPMGPNDTFVVAARGDQGDCKGAAALPVGAAGLVLNVTAVDASESTFLTLWPADRTRPNASSLNPAPGEPPTPNAVTVDLDAAGAFAVYNRFGQVHLLADVVGYYTDHHHDDRYFTQQQTAALVRAADPVVVAGAAPEFETSTIYDAGGLQLRMFCGISAGTTYLELRAASGERVWGHGTVYVDGAPDTITGWAGPGSAGTFLLGGSAAAFSISGAVITEDADRHAYSVVATFGKTGDCPYRIHLTPLGSTP